MEKFDNGENLTVEDRKKFDDADAELTRDKSDLDRLMKMRRTDEGIRGLAESRGESLDKHENDVDAYTRAYEKWFRSNPMAGGAGLLTNDEVRALSMGEQRDGAALGTNTGAGTDGAAGFLIPQGFLANLQIRLKEYGGLLNLCELIKTDSGNPMPWPTHDPTNQVGQYLTENTAVTGDGTIDFGQGMMHAWFISSGVILASYAIINDAAFSVDSFVTDRMGERIGRKIAAELHTGAGAASQALTGLHTALASYNQTNGTVGLVDAQPKGGYYQPAVGAGDKVFNLSNPSSAIATRAAGLISWQSVINMTKSVDPAYRQAGSCCFVMNDSTEGKVRSLTDGFGHPLWQPNVQVGPSTGPTGQIEGFPVTIDQNTASISTTAGTPGGVLFGDFKRAMRVRQVNQSGTLRLTERYAEYLQVGYIGYVRMDSLPNDLHAVVEYKQQTDS
jgi:HK97 family phage major capsid protein